MANFFSFSRNQTTVLLTLVFVLIFGAIYFFIYIPGNQSEIEEQRFRYLRKIEKNIHSKVDNAVALLNNELVSYEHPSPDFPAERVQESIITNPPKNLTLFPISKRDSVSAIDSVCHIDFNEQELIISLAKGGYQTRLKFTINQFIDSLLPHDVFDQYILLKGEKIVYQSFPIGVTGLLKDSLLTTKSVFEGNNVKDITLSGITFKLFSQQLTLNDTTSVIVAGLLTKDRYLSEKTKLPDNIVLFLLTIAISTILALPWIKLYQMGSQDRLTAADSLFSFAVSMLLMSLLFFGFFKYNVPFRPAHDQDFMIKKNLSAGVEKALSKEIGNAYNWLNELHRLRQENGITYSLQNFGKNKVKSKKDSTLGSLPEAVKAQLGASKYGLDLSQVFWLDATGKEVTNWATASENTPPGNFANRDYFKMLANNTPFLMYRNHYDQFYLEQVVSWTTGKFRSVLSKRYVGRETLVAAISLDLKSVRNVVLPAGFSYSIINDQGRVLYNSTPSKNLNENLIEEFSEHQKLRATIASGKDAFFKTRYIGNGYHVFVKRFDMLPYYIVIMENTSIKNVRDIKIFGFTFLMLLVLFAILVLQFVIVFFVSRRRTFFTRQYLDISWIGPHKSFHHTYHEIIIWNLLNIVILLILYNRISFLPFVLLLLFTSITVSIFLNFLFLNFYKEAGDQRFQLKRKALVALCLMLVLLNLLALQVQGIAWVLVYEILSLTLGVVFFRYDENVFELLRKIRSRLPAFSWNFSHSFSLMVFTRLVISSGIPAAFFYMAAFDYETNLIAKYRHTQFIKDIIDKSDHNTEKLNLTGAFVDSVWLEKLPEKVATVKESELEVDDNWLFDYFTSYNTAGANELYRHSPKGLFLYKKSPRDGVIQTVYQESQTLSIGVSSASLRYRLMDFSSWTNATRSAAYLIGFAFGLFFFWYALHRIIRKLFALDLPSQAGWTEMDQGLLVDKRANARMFVIGSPGTAILEKVEELIINGEIKNKADQKLIYDRKEKSGNTVFVADMLQVPRTVAEAKDDKVWSSLTKESLKGKHEVIIVDHFEYDMQNPDSNKLKQDFLESLLYAHKSKVIVISSLHPVNYLDSLNQQEIADANAKKIPEHNLDRWYVLLGGFSIVIEKLNRDKWEFGEKSLLWQAILKREAKSTGFLNALVEPAIANLKSTDVTLQRNFDGNDLAFKMETSASYFYMSIWQSLTKEEKFLLYDLAEDGLVNPYDENNLALLINKGLIFKANGGLVIFNKGFRDFILTSIGASEALKIRDQIRDNGNWNKLKTPLKILVFAVLAFLFTSQQEAYSTLLKYLSILTVALPATLKFLALFEKGNTKSSS